ncbi:MAG: ferrochelatase [Gemmatimonadota bacterium]
MKVAVMVLNFGEPESPTMEAVVPFLERIFRMNGSLDAGDTTPEQIEARARRLAEARAPGLIEEYEAIGGSPLHAQAREQSVLLGEELRRRGHDAATYLGYQFTDPSIADAVSAARAAGVDVVVGLPVYPLCGPSTSVAALDELDGAVNAAGWDVRLAHISGWHRHPAYADLRARAVRGVLERDGLSLADPGTRLVFSAHGTPMKYLREGSRYDVYVHDHCRQLASSLHVSEYELGFQNHSNRPVEWTQPDIDRVIEEVDASAVVVVPVSFMHEQSETLAELDHELREVAEGRGLSFHRVPVPHADPAFIGLLADLVEGALHGGAAAGEEVAGLPLQQCRCRPDSNTCCMNASLERAESLPLPEL